MKKTGSLQKINITSQAKQQLAAEFKCSMQTVYCALLYFNNSKLAQMIRARAKELLIEEANKIEADV